jgi:hypothetical protein
LDARTAIYETRKLLGGAISSSSSTIVLFPVRHYQKDPHGGGTLPALTRRVGRGMCGIPPWAVHAVRVGIRTDTG